MLEPMMYRGANFLRAALDNDGKVRAAALEARKLLRCNAVIG
jgi:hypothetical protein